MAGFIPNLSDYISAYQGLGPLQTALSDIPGGGVSSDIFSGAAPLVSGLALGGPIAGGIGALASLVPMIAGLFGGGRSSTGPGSATSDIASGGSAYSDPVIRLLSEGAGALGNSTPISSSSAGPTFGPYFDVARRLEDLVRWGPGGLTDPRAEGVDATTLKTALTELGNPGTDAGTGTLQALQNAFNSGSKYLTPDNISLLISQMSPQEQNIFNQIWGQPGGNTIPPGTIPSNPFNLPNPSPNFNPNSVPNLNFGPTQNPLFSNTNPAPLMQLLGLGGGAPPAPPVRIGGDWLGGRIGPPAMMGML